MGRGPPAARLPTALYQFMGLSGDVAPFMPTILRNPIFGEHQRMTSGGWPTGGPTPASSGTRDARRGLLRATARLARGQTRTNLYIRRGGAVQRPASFRKRLLERGSADGHNIAEIPRRNRRPASSWRRIRRPHTSHNSGTGRPYKYARPGRPKIRRPNICGRSET